MTVFCVRLARREENNMAKKNELLFGIFQRNDVRVSETETEAEIEDETEIEVEDETEIEDEAEAGDYVGENEVREKANLRVLKESYELFFENVSGGEFSDDEKISEILDRARPILEVRPTIDDIVRLSKLKMEAENRLEVLEAEKAKKAERAKRLKEDLEAEEARVRKAEEVKAEAEDAKAQPEPKLEPKLEPKPESKKATTPPPLPPKQASQPQAKPASAPKEVSQAKPNPAQMPAQQKKKHKKKAQSVQQPQLSKSEPAQKTSQNDVRVEMAREQLDKIQNPEARIAAAKSLLSKQPDDAELAEMFFQILGLQGTPEKLVRELLNGETWQFFKTAGEYARECGKIAFAVVNATSFDELVLLPVKKDDERQKGLWVDQELLTGVTVDPRSDDLVRFGTLYPEQYHQLTKKDPLDIDRRDVFMVTVENGKIAGETSLWDYVSAGAAEKKNS